jgi:hypothetical protein
VPLPSVTGHMPLEYGVTEVPASANLYLSLGLIPIALLRSQRVRASRSPDDRLREAIQRIVRSGLLRRFASRYDSDWSPFMQARQPTRK